MKKLASLGVASVPAVKQYLQQAAQEGLEYTSLIAEAGIAQAALQDNGAHVQGEHFEALLAMLIEQSGSSLFGLHSAQFVQASSYSVLGFMSMNCLTIGEAIERIMPFERLVGDMGVSTLAVSSVPSFDAFSAQSLTANQPSSTQPLKVTQSPQLNETFAVLSWNCRYTNSLVIPHMVDNVLASWLQFARLLVGKTLSPYYVTLQRSSPGKLADLQEYQRVFGCDIHFNAELDSLVFPVAFQSIEIQSGNAVLRQALEAHAKQLLTELEADHDQPFTALVSQFIQQGLAINQCRQQDVAVLLNISAKTLQRRLKAEGATFQGLLDNIRHQKACAILIDSEATIESISERLGFNDVRSFYHHFNRHEGMTPAQYRKQKSPR